MKRTIIPLLIAILAPVTSDAALLFDSGEPATGSFAFGPSFNQNFAYAAKISFDSDSTITSVESYFAAIDMTATAAVFADGGTLPTGDPLHEAAFNINGGLDWYGPSGLDWFLDAGSYWFGFYEPTGLENGGASTRSSPPLKPDATVCGTVLNQALTWTTSPSVCGANLTSEGIGLRINGEEVDLSPIPIPAAAWLFGTALIGLVGFSKRREAA